MTYTVQAAEVRREIDSIYREKYTIMQGVWNLHMLPCPMQKYRAFKEILDLHSAAARYWPEEEK